MEIPPEKRSCARPGGFGEKMVLPVLRRIALISGPPASGKTTIARPLAESLECALLSKDDLKESLFSSMNGLPGDLDFSHRLSVAAMDLLWALAPHCPSVMLEGNFRTQSPHERKQVALLLNRFDGNMVEIHCRIPIEEAARRFAERARTERHHPAHALQEMSVNQLREYATPFAMSPVIEVDTNGPVDIAVLAQRASAALRS
jgi:predicted kinase